MKNLNDPLRKSRQLITSVGVAIAILKKLIVPLMILLAIAALLGGWCMNIYTIATTPEISPLTGMMVARIIGIFVAPLGGVLGFF